MFGQFDSDSLFIGLLIVISCAILYYAIARYNGLSTQQPQRPPDAPMLRRRSIQYQLGADQKSPTTFTVVTTKTT